MLQPPDYTNIVWILSFLTFFLLVIEIFGNFSRGKWKRNFLDLMSHLSLYIFLGVEENILKTEPFYEEELSQNCREFVKNEDWSKMIRR